MSQPNQMHRQERRVIDALPMLLELGRMGEVPPGTLEAGLPNIADFSVFWQKWDLVVVGWEAAKVADLIKGLTLFERVFDRGFGSVPPIPNLFRIYSSMVDLKNREDLANWILANTVNSYVPYGTDNHGARSLAELDARRQAVIASKSAKEASDKRHRDEQQRLKTQQSTERLPNALRRRDQKAVAALIAKGADPDAVLASGMNARLIAQELGVESWLSGECS